MNKVSAILWLAGTVVVPAQTGSRAAETLAELVEEVLHHNAEILAAQKKYEATRQRPRQASALPDTTLAPGYASNARPWPGSRLGLEPTSNLGFMISQEIPFPGKRGLRGDIAEVEARAEFEAYRSTQLNVVLRVKQAYFRLAHSDLVRGVLERNRVVLEQLLKVTEIRYSVGKAAQQDAFKLQTQLSILKARLVQLEREEKARREEILSLLSRGPGAGLGRAAMTPPTAMPAPLEELLAAAERNSPSLQRDRLMIQRSELAVNLARKDYYPDYTVSAGYFNMGRMADMFQFRMDFKLPTSYFRKQRGAVTEQAMTAVQARRSFESGARSVAFRIKDSFLQAETSLELMQIYEKTVTPQANLALESSLAGYETGAVDLLSVLSNFITILEYEMNYHEEMLNAHLALAQLEELTGTHLIHGGGQK
jgi:outer membrane protein TolC